MIHTAVRRPRYPSTVMPSPSSRDTRYDRRSCSPGVLLLLISNVRIIYQVHHERADAKGPKRPSCDTHTSYEPKNYKTQHDNTAKRGNAAPQSRKRNAGELSWPPSVCAAAIELNMSSCNKQLTLLVTLLCEVASRSS